jgi:hypothetical protein
MVEDGDIEAVARNGTGGWGSREGAKARRARVRVRVGGRGRQDHRIYGTGRGTWAAMGLRHAGWEKSGERKNHFGVLRFAILRFF